MRSIRRMIIGLTLFAVVAAVGVAARAQATREELERQLAEQQARNEALRKRVTTLEAALAADVCADPKPAETLLGKKVEPEKKGEPAPAEAAIPQP